MRSQLLAARLALVLLLLAALAAAAAVAGVRAAVLTYDAGLNVMTGATILGLAALALALTWLLKALIRNDGAGKRIGLIALIGSAAVVYVPLHNVARGWREPPINDVSSNPDVPPLFVALAKRRTPGMNSPQPDSGQRVHYKGETNTAAYMLHTYYFEQDNNPITKPHASLTKTPLQMFWHAFETAKKMGWSIIDYGPAQGRIEATDTSFWFGQVTDIVIQVQKAGQQGSRVDVRLQSRIGKRDFGRNIELLGEYFHAFKGGGF